MTMRQLNEIEAIQWKVTHGFLLRFAKANDASMKMLGVPHDATILPYLVEVFPRDRAWEVMIDYTAPEGFWRVKFPRGSKAGSCFNSANLADFPIPVDVWQPFLDELADARRGRA